MWAGADTQVVTAGTAEAGTKRTREENGRCADSKSGLVIRQGETDGWLAGTETRGMGRLLSILSGTTSLIPPRLAHARPFPTESSRTMAAILQL